MRLLALKRRLLSLLAEEIKAYLPQFEPHATDYQMVVYACRDLEAWMRCKWTVNSQRAVYERIEETWEYEPQDFKVFLNFWVGSWIEKWRERVQVLSKKPKLPPRLQEEIERSKKLYRGMDHRKELKKMVTEKLMLQGEICMAEIIAENLIVEEIAKRSRGTDKDQKLVTMDPVDIYNSLSRRISKLPEEKRPLIYLNVKLYTF
jgi:hypothetical protein